MININMKELIAPAVSFIKSLKQKDRVVIVHGHDADSICSAAIIYKLIRNEKKITPIPQVSESNSHLKEETLGKIKKLKPTHVIIVDIANIGVDIITKMRNFSQVMIIDHHVPKGYAKIIYVNPRMFDREIYLPATYVCYKIYEEFSNPKEIVWIAGIGNLGDMGLKNCPDLFNKIKSEYKELVDDFEVKDEILIEKSLLGKLTQIIDSGMIVKEKSGSVFALKVLIDVKKYKDVMENKTLLNYYKLVKSEFEKTVKDFEKNKKIIDNVVLYEIKSPLKLKSGFASYVGKLFDDKIIAIYQKDGEKFSFSLRKGKNMTIDLDNFGKEVTRGIENADGGGHPNAAGMNVPLKHIKSLIENMRLKTNFGSEKR